MSRTRRSTLQSDTVKHVCTCDAYDFPHREYSGKCKGRRPSPEDDLAARADIDNDYRKCYPKESYYG